MSEARHPDDCGCGACTGPLRPLKPDGIVEGLDPEMCGPGGLAVFRGYLGDGATDGVWRLYTTLELDEYFLIRERDIVSQRQSGSASIVWVRRDSSVRYVRLGRAGDLAPRPSTGRAGQAAFLRGGIAQRATMAGGGLQDPVWLTDDPAPPPDTWTAACPASYTSKRPCC